MTECKQYSKLFTTIGEEETKHGSGRSLHHSIVKVNRDESKRIAIIWDEDRDERVISVLEEFVKHKYSSIFWSIVFIGVRNNTLYVLMKDDTWVSEKIDLINGKIVTSGKRFEKQAWLEDCAIIQSIAKNNGLECDVKILNNYQSSGSLIQGDSKSVAEYLRTIVNKWDIK